MTSPAEPWHSHPAKVSIPPSTDLPRSGQGLVVDGDDRRRSTPHPSLVRGLFTHSYGHNATIQFNRHFPNIVCVLQGNGHSFDVNFTVGPKRLVEISRDNDVLLDPSACRPVALIA